MNHADVSEGVRATIAAYVQALDDGRTDDLVATFCADGVCDIPGMGTFEGAEAIRTAFAKWKPVKPQRHLVVNTLLTSWDDNEAEATSDMVFLLKAEPGWAVQLVGRYDDTLHYGDGRWRFHHRTATFL